MYFLTNKEDYIVAASSDFLNAIGTREICSISAMLQNQLITLDKDNNKLNIPNKDLEYAYTISTMHSAFGNLNLYTLTTPTQEEQVEEDENIAYLKKIQEGTVEKKDNEYAIPDIPTLHKETKEEVVETEKVALSEEAIKEETISIKEQNEEEAKTLVEEKTKEPKIDLDNNELINSLKNIDTDFESSDIATDKSIDKLADEIIETENKQEIEETIDNKVSDTAQKSELIEQVENIEDRASSTKESGLKRITKKLFPWGNKKSEEIELEDNTPYETDLRSASELLEDKETKVATLKEDSKKESPEQIKAVDIEQEDKIEEIKIPEVPSIKTVEESKEELKNSIDELKIPEIPTVKEEIKIPEVPSIKLEDEEKLELQKAVEEIKTPKIPTIEPEEEIKIPEVPSIKLEDEAEEKLEPQKEVEEIKTPEIPTIEPEEEIKVQEPIEAIKPTVELEKTDTEDIISKISTIETKEEKTEEPIKLESTKPTVQEDIEKSVIPEKQLSTADTKPQVEINKVEEVSVVNDKDSNKITYKLMKLQIEAIDLEKNANKLSIDASSYKMLLGNYLDEIEKYNNELENGATSTIDMLQDAGELLSLNILTQKLEKLKSSSDRRETTKEISLMASLLKEKLEKKPVTEAEVTKVEAISREDIPKEEPEEVEVVEKKEISIPPIPDEVIDITSAQDLLTSITPQSVSFNPNRAAEELNLPKTLILEFVEDFISQSKEHLPVMVDAYKKEDIKTIQTTAHMLKGAASNLRLDTIAENLFKIQKEGNINNSGELIKQFVAKLKGLSSEVASLEDAEDEN